MLPSDPTPIISDAAYNAASGIVQTSDGPGATFSPPRQRGRAVPPAEPAGGPLGSNARFVSAEGGNGPRRPDYGRRYGLQRVAQRILPAHRVAQCMRAMTGGLVEVLHHPEHGTASFKGLQTCGSAWVCPVCSAKILARRGAELAAGVERWQAMGGDLLMLTLTLRHERNIPLALYLDGLNEAYRLLRQGRAWHDFKRRYGLQGSVTRREITHGAAGWHPHLHGLLFFERPASQAELITIQAWLKKRWVKVLHRLGFDASIERGCDLRPAGEGAVPYMTKLTAQWSIGKELTDGDAKKALHGNSSIAEILLRADSGEADAIELFREYAKATYGKAVLVWSSGLRKLIAPDEPEATDEEIAQEAGAGAVGLVALTRVQWLGVLEGELRGELLNVAAGGDVGELAAWLARNRIILSEEQIGYGRRGDAIHGTE